MKPLELGIIKYLLFGFNLLFAISGLGIIIAGSLVLSDVGEFSHFMEGKVLAPPVVLIVTGCVVFLVASLGCYGAIRESYKMLMAFAACLLVIFIIELAVGIAAAVYKDDFHKGLKELMRDSMDRFETSESDRIAWNNLQKKMECCGVDRSTDWPEHKRPLSCCHVPREGAPEPDEIHCWDAKPGDPILYTEGCFDKIEMKAVDSCKIILGVGIGIAFVEIIGIVLACWLASAIKKRTS
ncbi:CD63 antigen-like [Cylas formicarius]|uniref:CD63 antigen-like n=1 Tax=Cylas formicarius TaxID=197179 RepID=UPI0029588AE5|nr:CD63 antigen-like [Cylas formicarius]